MSELSDDERLYKIGEVCRMADVQPYVLRYWETEFPSLAPHPILIVERVHPIRVDGEHRDQLAVGPEHRHDDLRLRIRIARNVAGERTHVGDDDRLAPLRRRAADAAAEFDLQAADRADVRADDEAIAADAVEAGPEERLEAMRQDGVDRGHERDVVERLAAFVAPDGGDGVVALGVRVGF